MIESKLDRNGATPGAFATSPGVVAREMDGVAVLIHLASNRIFELNGPGARIWALVGEGCTRDQIVSRLGAEFRDSQDLDSAVDDLLAALTREGLIRAC
jgi:hypothetical protein